MSCDLLEWAVDLELPLAQSRAISKLARLAVDGRATITKAALAALIGLKERQTHTVLMDLANRGLICVERHGGAGKGRAANSYLLRPDAGANCTEAQSAIQCSQQPSTGIAIPALDRSQQPIACTGAPSAAAEKSPYENNSYPLELYPEPLALGGEVVVIAASSDTPPPPAWQRVVDAVRSPHLDPNKQARLILEGAEVQGWLDAGADETLDVLPTVRRLIEAKGEPVPWKYFRKAVREATARRLAAEAPQQIITAEEAGHDIATRNANDFFAPARDSGRTRRSSSPRAGYAEWVRSRTQTAE